MNFPNLSLAGISGIQTGLDNLRKDAEKIAQATTKREEDSTDLTQALVDLNTDRHQIEASVKVVKAVDEVLGTLLDLRA